MKIKQTGDADGPHVLGLGRGRREGTFRARDETQRDGDKKCNKTLHRRPSDECVSVIIQPADAAALVLATSQPQGTVAEEGDAAPLTRFITASNGERQRWGKLGGGGRE